MALVIAGILGTLWAWIVWIVIGGIAGAIADRLMQGNQLGIVGNIIVGILGGLLGGVILGLFGISVSGIFLTFVTALVGAIILLWIARAVTGGRGVSSRY
ncbi:MAG: GlsB/YeaQ/YmgE family stress response membrane protein [Ktedonobacteraceae bacterium]|nr:GlsB/YeaQ/YmgE family stress response membrane protein [Ktedonobacteraceae bacterium]MBO0794494.1 GlsB/YeaQ/YmgE family stress response membrane protein [Ktedonobacteraceae bacterium]